MQVRRNESVSLTCVLTFTTTDALCVNEFILFLSNFIVGGWIFMTMIDAKKHFALFRANQMNTHHWKRPQKNNFNPFAPGDFAEKRVLKLAEWFSGHCRAIKS